jgi:hypothetical protein
MSVFYKLIKHPHWGWRIMAAIGAAVWALLAWLMFTDPAAAQHQDAPARAVIDCGSLEGSGSVVVIVGERHLRVNIHCQRT